MSRYAFAGTGDDAERRRLAHLERYANPVTIRQLDAIDVANGWRCLDVGAGAGSVTRQLADRVGRFGTVVATDLDPRFLTELPDHVEVRRHDITVDGLEPDAFDLVHSRLVLMHLDDPAAALERMTDALKPGGWLVVTEADWGLVALGGHPDAAWATRYLHELFRRHAPAGVRKPYFGRELAPLIADLGLTDLQGEITGLVAPPGTSALELHRLTIEGLRPTNVEVGGSEDDLDRLGAVLDAPSVTCTGVALVAMRGRRAER
jgi:SAM-dependent methyltransferase